MSSIGNEHAVAQSARVAELENQNETLIKTIAELTKSISQGRSKKQHWPTSWPRRRQNWLNAAMIGLL